MSQTFTTVWVVSRKTNGSWKSSRYGFARCSKAGISRFGSGGYMLLNPTRLLFEHKNELNFTGEMSFWGVTTHQSTHSHIQRRRQQWVDTQLFKYTSIQPIDRFVYLVRWTRTIATTQTGLQGWFSKSYLINDSIQLEPYSKNAPVLYFPKLLFFIRREVFMTIKAYGHNITMKSTIRSWLNQPSWTWHCINLSMC